MKIVIFILIILGVVLGILLKYNNGQVQRENKTDQSPTISPAFQTQTNSEGEVAVEVTPIVLSDKENVQFKISLNTHSVALDKNLKDISVLFDDAENGYQPISWSGGTGGHHLEGVLIFAPLAKSSKSAKLIIKDINSIDREFLFPL